jgi:hypothetical protein
MSCGRSGPFGRAGVARVEAPLVRLLGGATVVAAVVAVVDALTVVAVPMPGAAVTAVMAGVAVVAVVVVVAVCAVAVAAASVLFIPAPGPCSARVEAGAESRPEVSVAFAGRGTAPQAGAA